MAKSSIASKYIGDKYGRLTCLAFVRVDVAPSGFRCRVFRFRCDCGNTVDLSIYKARSGNSQSCGCLRREMMTRHGQSNSDEYTSWEHMIQRGRSADPEVAKNYADRGIVVCNEWKGVGGFQSFVDCIGPKPSPKHTVERIDNDKGYEPGNVKWATKQEQQFNTRRNRYVTVAGKRMCLAEACRLLDLNYYRTLYRIRSGWPEEEALYT